MDWNIDRINQYNLLEAVELGSIQVQKKSTHYSAYIRIAFSDYHQASHARKKELIRFITIDDNAYPGDYMTRDYVNQAWSNMLLHSKNAWKQHANHLKLLQFLDDFRVLPNALVGHLEQAAQEYIWEECDLFKFIM